MKKRTQKHAKATNTLDKRPLLKRWRAALRNEPSPAMRAILSGCISTLAIWEGNTRALEDHWRNMVIDCPAGEEDACADVYTRCADELASEEDRIEGEMLCADAFAKWCEQRDWS